MLEFSHIAIKKFKYIFDVVLKLDDINRYFYPNPRLLSLPFGNLISRSLC